MNRDCKGYSSKAVANELIRLAQKENCGLTHMQLQKLAYFAHALTLVLYSRPLIEKGFQAWPFGPVNLDLYSELQGSGKNAIKRFIELDRYKEEIQQDRNVMEIIESVYQKLGKQDGWELSRMTHQKGAPWSESFEEGKSNPIDDGAILYYYGNLLKV